MFPGSIVFGFQSDDNPVERNSLYINVFVFYFVLFEMQYSQSQVIE